MRPRRAAAAGVRYRETGSDDEDSSPAREVISTRPRRATRRAIVTDSGSENSPSSGKKVLGRSVSVSDEESDNDRTDESSELVNSEDEEERNASERKCLPSKKAPHITSTKPNGASRLSGGAKQAACHARAVSKRKKTTERRRQSCRSSTTAASSSNYVEADSDDEFARQNLMYGSDEEQPLAQSQSDDDELSESSDTISYHVERILSCRTLTAAEWRGVCDKMNTREVNNGSVWKQPDEEYHSDSPELVLKYLIKWAHSSYLHVSWETEKDLLGMASPSVKAMLSRFAKRSSQPPDSADPFSDLRAGEYIPPSFLTIERILDVEDPNIDALSIDYMEASLPGEDHREGSTPLHGDDCFVVVKWEGLTYSDTSFESLNDIRSAGMDYEAQLRAFFRREQRAPASQSRRGLKDDLDLSVIESSEPPPFPGGVLRNYQWEGVRWLLFNWTQRRNSILADEMVRWYSPR